MNFPFFLLNFSISPFLIQFTETFGIRWYSIMYLLGLGITYYWLTKVEKYDKTQTSDFVFYGLLSTILGARLGFVLFYQPHLLVDPLNAIAIWNGGMSFHGGLIGLLLFTWWFSKRHKWSTLKLFDDLATPAALFLTFGRIGNFLNNELWGNITTVPWCLYTNVLEGCRHPSQLYEALYNLTLFIILLVNRKRSPFQGGAVPISSALRGSAWLKKTGIKSSLFLIWYGTFRSLTELFWRSPDWTWHGITAGQTLSIPMIIAGISLLIWSVKATDHQLISSCNHDIINQLKKQSNIP